MQVLGASWYLLSIERQYSCWTQECRKELNFTHSPSCSTSFLDCWNYYLPERRIWLSNTKVLTECDARDDSLAFKFGMFADAFINDVASSNIIEKYFYCLWWGLKNLRYVWFYLKLSIVPFFRMGSFFL